LLEQLGRLKGLISQAHRLADEMPSISPAPLLNVANAVARDCRSLFPAVAIQIHAHEVPRELAVRVYDGEAGLRRILENILQNACEGNGTEAASRIRVEIAGSTDRVSLRCVDDGPGFSAVQLATP